MWYFNDGERVLNPIESWIFRDLAQNLLGDISEEMDTLSRTYEEIGIQLTDYFSMDQYPLSHWNVLTYGEQVAALCEVMKAFLDPNHPRPNQTALLESAAIAPFLRRLDEIDEEIDEGHCSYRRETLAHFFAAISPEEISELAAGCFGIRYDNYWEEEGDDPDESEELAFQNLMQSKRYYELLQIPRSPWSADHSQWLNLVETLTSPYFADYDWQCTVYSGGLDSEAEIEKEWRKKEVVDMILTITPDYSETHLNKLFLGDPKKLLKEVKKRWGEKEGVVPDEARLAIKRHRFDYLLDPNWGWAK